MAHSVSRSTLVRAGQGSLVIELMKNAKVFGIGLSRTGTTSLSVALETLGYRVAHFTCDPDTQAEISNYPPAATEIRLSVLKTYDAITDTPVCLVYKALDRSHPECKFILTVREKQPWLRSCDRYWKGGLLRDMETAPDRSYIDFSNFVNSRIYGSEHFDCQLFSRAYDKYVDDVIGYFTCRNRALLVLDICGGEGWQHLCDFLNTQVPEIPFPSENGGILSTYQTAQPSCAD